MFRPAINLRVGGFVAVATLLFAACDGGLAPPVDTEPGVLAGEITYVGTWPDQSEIQDLRFVALRFVPQDTADFLQLNRLIASDPLTYGVDSESFVIRDVDPGVFPFSGVARRESTDLFSWGPLGLYETNDGIIEVGAGDSVHITILVNLDVLPDFP